MTQILGPRAIVVLTVWQTLAVQLARTQASSLAGLQGEDRVDARGGGGSTSRRHMPESLVRYGLPPNRSINRSRVMPCASSTFPSRSGSTGSGSSRSRAASSSGGVPARRSTARTSSLEYRKMIVERRRDVRPKTASLRRPLQRGGSALREWFGASGRWFGRWLTVAARVRSPLPRLMILRIGAGLVAAARA